MTNLGVIDLWLSCQACEKAKQSKSRCETRHGDVFLDNDQLGMEILTKKCQKRCGQLGLSHYITLESFDVMGH